MRATCVMFHQIILNEYVLKQVYHVEDVTRAPSLPSGWSEDRR